jgi:hypothetical protein
MSIFDKVKKSVLWFIRKDLIKAQEITKKKIEEKTPEDTKKLIGSYKTSPLNETFRKIEVNVTNDIEYAQYVEYWVKNKPYNYHKPKGNVFRIGVGARMFQRTKEENQKEILSFLNKKSKIIIKWTKLILQK